MAPTPDRVALTSDDAARVDSALASAERYSGVELLAVVVGRDAPASSGWLQRWLGGAEEEADLTGVADSVLHDRRHRRSQRPWGLVLCVAAEGDAAAVLAEPEVLTALSPQTVDGVTERLQERLRDRGPAAALVQTLEELQPLLASGLPRPLRAAGEEPHRVIVL